MRSAFALIAAAGAIAASALPAQAQGPERFDRGDRYDQRPGGSYVESCRDIQVRRNEITAQCRSRNGSWIWSRASANCNEMENKDGYLVCVRGGGRPGGPGRPGGGWNGGGGGRADVVLFEHAGFDGRAYEVDGDISNFASTGFNDRASSIQIRRGEWELCSDSNYRGRCWRLSSDVRVFPREMNDRVSSIRRIR